MKTFEVKQDNKELKKTINQENTRKMDYINLQLVVYNIKSLMNLTFH